jgi:hypothetical protein
MPAQWELASQFDAVHDFLSIPRDALERLYGLPEILDGEAPEAYARRTLIELSKILQWGEWVQRILVERQVSTRGISRVKLAELSTVSTATIQKWWSKPLPTTDNYEYGPGLTRGPLTDAVKRKAPPVVEGETLPYLRQCECGHSQWMHTDHMAECTCDAGGSRCGCPMFRVVADGEMVGTRS